MDVDFSQAIDSMPVAEARLLCHKLLADVQLCMGLQSRVIELQTQVEELQDIAIAVGELFLEEVNFAVTPESARGRLWALFTAYAHKGVRDGH